MEPTFSRRWREVFGHVDDGRTTREADFLASVLPLSGYRRVLDVPCGTGRHARALTALGYAVVGVDLDEAVVSVARAAGTEAHVGDMRDLRAWPTDFDAVVCLWASFGYFDRATNERVLTELAARLRPGARLVLDLPSASYFEPRQGERELRPGIVERSRVVAGRRVVELDYGDGVEDRFSWQLFDGDEIEELGRERGLELVLAAAGFDATADARDVPSMQLVLARGA